MHGLPVTHPSPGQRDPHFVILRVVNDAGDLSNTAINGGELQTRNTIRGKSNEPMASPEHSLAWRQEGEKGFVGSSITVIIFNVRTDF